MFSPNLLGFSKGPAHIKSKEVKLNDYWKIVNIPLDIPSNTAINNIKSFLSEIVAIEIPSSLMCNCNCLYCYIREKWLKNTLVTVEEIKKITELSWKHILCFDDDNKKEKVISSWGAEPFCNVPTLDYLVDFCIDNKMIINFSTNGTILNESIKKMIYKYYKNCVEKNMPIKSFQISLDGPKNIQDKYRPMYSGESNYDHVIKFIDFLEEVQRELGICQQLYSLCSTIYLSDSEEESLQIYKESIDFFTNKSERRFYNPILPIRIENSKNFTKKDADLFYKIIETSTEFLIEKSEKVKEGFLDNYASKLFLDSGRIDGWPRCSAMNTQVSVDIDGTLYPCHGPITTSFLKPFLAFGNLIDGIIDYRRFISVLDGIYSDITFKSVCKNCEIGKTCAGNICFSCTPVALANNYEPVNFNIHMCNIFQKCFPLWKKQYEQFLKFK
ncbi:hypothetical protein EOM09_01710 [bacterium]|nr:hypothetical protein [bacterium]